MIVCTVKISRSFYDKYWQLAARAFTVKLNFRGISSQDRGKDV